MKFSQQSERQFAVIGLGRFGRNMAKALHEMGYDVLAIDKDMEKSKILVMKLLMLFKLILLMKKLYAL